jgi:hypothetical protein
MCRPGVDEDDDDSMDENDYREVEEAAALRKAAKGEQGI